MKKAMNTFFTISCIILVFALINSSLSCSPAPPADEIIKKDFTDFLKKGFLSFSIEHGASDIKFIGKAVEGNNASVKIQY